MKKYLWLLVVVICFYSACQKTVINSNILITLSDQYDVQIQEKEILIFSHITSCNYCIEEIKMIDKMALMPIKLIVVNKSNADAAIFYQDLGLSYAKLYVDTLMISARSNYIEWIPSKAIVSPEKGIIKSDIIGLGGNLHNHLSAFISE